jgi:hypothetical protein
VPTQRHAGLLDHGPGVVFLRVHVALRDGHIAVTGQVGQGPRVHERRPAREASVAEGVEREVRHLSDRACFGVLTLKTRRLNLAASGPCRKHPWPFDVAPPHIQDRLDMLRKRNAPTGVVGLAVHDLDSAVLTVFPSETKAFFGTDAAIQENCSHVPE